MKRSINLFVLFGLLMLLVVACGQQTDKTGADQIPQDVLEALNAKFPDAEINKWTSEDEEDVVIYDLEFTQNGQKLEADIMEDGTIHNWEKAITNEDLPVAVQDTFNEKYPDAEMKEIMEITAVIEGEDQLEGYEIVFETPDNKEFEITIAPDGNIIEEDSGDEEVGEER